LDIEIATIVKNRPKKVKPGYKKKITIEIEQLKRKKKRQMIQNSIKEQQKFKSKMKQIEKGKQE
jgi:ATP-dependent RNA helicase CshB